MSEAAAASGSGAAARPPLLWLVVLSGMVAVAGLLPWAMAAMFAPALLGAPGPGPRPTTILGVAAVLSYPIWLWYWAGRVIAARRAGGSGAVAALVMAAPGAMLLGAFAFFSFGP
jgi:hypothetical protein